MHFLKALDSERVASKLLYPLVEQLRSDFEVEKICTALSLSRGGFYRWQHSISCNKDEHILKQIKQIHAASRGVFGAPRITAKLKQQGLKHNHKKVARIMRENNIQSKMKRKFKVTTNSNHKLPICDNLLNRKFNPTAENELWCGDISYIKTVEGWLYLAIVIDLYSRKIIGWAMDRRMKAELVSSAFTMAWRQRGRPEWVTFHSDRGSQYASRKFTELLSKCNAKQSMSRAGNCWDNACAESFFASLKKEEVYQKKYPSRADAKSCIFEYIELFYNSFRPHSHCGGLSPNEFEQFKLYRKSA